MKLLVSPSQVARDREAEAGQNGRQASGTLGSWASSSAGVYIFTKHGGIFNIMTGVRYYHVFYLISGSLRQDPIRSIVGHSKAEGPRVCLVNRNFGSRVETASKMIYLTTIVAPHELASTSIQRRKA